jgi:hypothetical protein
MTQRLYAYTQDDRTKLDGIEPGAEPNNISDVNATALTDGGETTLHSHASSPIDSFEASETSTITTTSMTDTLVTGMALTPGAGNYLVMFSASWKNANNDTNYVSVYANSVQVAHSERRFYTEDSIPDTPTPVATQCRVMSLGAGQTIEIKWRVSGDTGTMYQRTLTLLKIG